MSFVCFNGTMLPASQALFPIQNRGFKYGDGVFETIKVHHDTIPLAAYHFERLYQSLALLKMDIPVHFNNTLLLAQILELCRLNHCLPAARVRLAVYRDMDNTAAYAIEAVELDPIVNQWNSNGFSLSLFPDVRKCTDAFANLKTANYLPYVMADRYSKEKGFDECLVLNSFDRICDASKANVFAVKGADIYTPALSEGGVNGVMRRFLIDRLKEEGYAVHQIGMEPAFLQSVDEVFLTNAIVGMRWVQQWEQTTYTCRLSKDIYHELVLPLFQ